MKYSHSVITLSKQILDVTTKFVNAQVNDTDKSGFNNLVSSLVKELNVEWGSFEEKRKTKLEKNGGFLKGYILMEKVLPVGEDSFQHKLNRDDRKDTASGAQKIIGNASKMGVRPTPEKLVRDRIPEQVEKQAVLNGIQDYRAKTRVVEGEEKNRWVKEKLKEESTEFYASVQNGDPVDEVLEDLGDTADLVNSLTN